MAQWRGKASIDAIDGNQGCDIGENIAKGGQEDKSIDGLSKLLIEDESNNHECGT